MKKIFVVTIVLLFAIFSFNSYAYETVFDVNYTSNENTVSPLYEPVCGTHPSHRMVASGFGTVIRDGEYYISGGAAWQCSRCYLVMVTEGDIYLGEMSPIGRYATWHDIREPINTNGCIINGADYYGYTSRNYLSGYTFYLVA